MTYDPVIDQKEFDNFLNELFSKHDSPEFICGPFSILLKNKPIGMIGLGYKSDAPVNYELWYLLNPDHSGKGIMQEAVECILDYIKTFRTVDKVCAYSVSQNENSSNLLNRNNFKLIETFKNGFEKNSEKFDVQYFELDLSS
jgi:ribosomal-protein-alanine N-acetyltransferase